MASVPDICNIALSHVGDDAVITSIDPPDGTVQAGHCRRFYPIARKAMIEMGPWGFATARAELAEVANASNVWAYAYALPSNCLKPLRVLRAVGFPYVHASIYEADTLSGNLTNEQGGSEFVIENGVLFTHEPEAVLIYRRDITDTTKFTPTFVIAIGYMLGSFLAGPIVKGMDGVQLGAKLLEMAMSWAAQAAVLDANSTTETNDHLPSSLRARQ